MPRCLRRSVTDHGNDGRSHLYILMVEVFCIRGIAMKEIKCGRIK